MEFGPAENDVEFDFGDRDIYTEKLRESHWGEPASHDRDFEQFVCTPILRMELSQMAPVA